MGHGQALSLIVAREERDHQRLMIDRRHTRLLATLIRNQWSKKPLTPQQFWPLEGDKDETRKTAKPRSEMTPEEKDAALYQLFAALGGN